MFNHPSHTISYSQCEPKMLGHRRVADLCCVGAGGEARGGGAEAAERGESTGTGVPPLPHDQRYLTSLELHAFLYNEDNNDHDRVEDGGHFM